MTKISIIIPIYNVEKYIRTALDSVVNQTLNDIEIICVNDCTPDNSFEIVKGYASRDNRFVLLEQETNQGQGAARNRALDIAKGEYVMFLDPDDWYELDACKEAYNQITKYNNDFSFFNLYIEENNICKIDTSRLNRFSKDLENPHIEFNKLTYPFFGNGESVYKIYNRGFLNKNNIKFSKERMGEDLFFYVQVITNAKDASILNKPLYHYRINENSTIFKAKYDSLLTVQKQCLEHCKNSQYSELYTKYYSISYIYSLIYWFKRWTKTDKTIEEDFYNKLRTAFIELDRLGIDSYIKQNLKNRTYKTYRSFINSSYRVYKLKTLPKRILKKILPF